MATTVRAIGIDFGTTKSSVAVFRNNQVEIIPNNLGSKMTPSYVSFTSTGRLIGQAAKDMMAENPSNTVYDLKRLLGRRYEETACSSDMNPWPFKVIHSYQNKPKVEVEYKGETKSFYPEEVTAMILRKMKKTAEAYLGEPVTDAVISIPAHFNDAQRRAINDAAKIAGLNVLRILNEPSAAALAYCFQNKAMCGITQADTDGEEEKNILVYDLGGGTFDASVITIKSKKLVVKSTRGDSHLGGEDFDNRMVKHFIKEFKQKHKEDLSINESALIRLRTVCEEANKLLSSALEAPISITSLLNGIDFHSSITRQQFEELNDDLFISSLDLVRKALRDAGMLKSKIHEVVLIGGSTRIPKIQEMLKVFFDIEDLDTSFNPDEVVVCGAAIQAAILQERVKTCWSLKRLSDIAGRSLGIGFPGGMMSTMIERNKEIPVTLSTSFTSCFDNQGSVKLMVCEGEKLKVEENKLLATITLNDIHALPIGKPIIYLTFKVMSDGVFSAFPSYYSHGVRSSIDISYQDFMLSDEEIIRLREDSERYSLYDDFQRDLEARNALESYFQNVQSRLEKAMKKCREMSELLGGPDHQKIGEDETKEMKEEMERLLKDITPSQEP